MTAISSPPFLLIVASLMVLIASATICSNIKNNKATFYSNNYGSNADGSPYTGCTGDLGWAVACPSVTIGLVLIFFIVQWFASALAAKAEFWLAAFLTIFWIPGAFVMTFRGPFLATGNGYFGAWAALIAACFWAVGAGVYDAIKSASQAFVSRAKGGSAGGAAGEAKVAQKSDVNEPPA